MVQIGWNCPIVILSPVWIKTVHTLEGQILGCQNWWKPEECPIKLAFCGGLNFIDTVCEPRKLPLSTISNLIVIDSDEGERERNEGSQDMQCHEPIVKCVTASVTATFPAMVKPVGIAKTNVNTSDKGSVSSDVIATTLTGDTIPTSLSVLPLDDEQIKNSDMPGQESIIAIGWWTNQK